MKSGDHFSSCEQDAVECVCGVLLSNGRVLVEKRRVDDEADPGLVMLPGGHVETGESLEDALKREMQEELGIRVLTMEPLRTRYYTPSNGERQRIHYFHVARWSGEIGSHEAEAVYWESDLANLSDPTERELVFKLRGQEPSI